MISPNPVTRSTANSGEGRKKPKPTETPKQGKKKGQVPIIRDMNERGKTLSSESPT